MLTKKNSLVSAFPGDSVYREMPGLDLLIDQLLMNIFNRGNEFKKACPKACLFFLFDFFYSNESLSIGIM